MIITLLKSTRPDWAAKNVHMYLLVITYAYFFQINISNPLQIIEGLILVSVLWGALYSLNDFTDIEVDKIDKSKKNRAFIQKTIHPRLIFVFFTALTSLVFIVSLLTLPPHFQYYTVINGYKSIIVYFTPYKTKRHRSCPII